MDWPITKPSAHYRPITLIDTAMCVHNNNRPTYMVLRNAMD